MLEAMLPGMRSGVKTEGNTIFLLNDFNTVADIVDKGPLKNTRYKRFHRYSRARQSRDLHELSWRNME